MTFSTTPIPSAVPTCASGRRGRPPAARLGLAVAALVAVGSFATSGSANAATASPSDRSLSSVVRAREADPIAEQAALALTLFREFSDSSDSSVGFSYVTQRDALAAAVAARLSIDPATMQRAWAAADDVHQEALIAGLTQLGVPYRRNTSKQGEGFDCSGLTTFAWAQAGLTLTRQSGSQIRQADPRTAETAQAGDLVQYPGHVMLWLGVGKAILHSPYPGRNVEVDGGPARRTLKYGDPTGPAAVG